MRASDGALLCEGVPVREGILVYRNKDGTERRELVTRDAVLDTARTIARAPVTLLHPADPKDPFVTATNIDKLGVGDVDGEVAVDEEEGQGGFARVKIAVRRKDAIDAISSGMQELSPGYDVELDETPGEHQVFGRYDARQVGRNVNHLAIVPKGRGGSTVRLRADSTDAEPLGWAKPSTAASGRTDNEDRHMRTLPLLLAALGMTQRYDTDEAAVDAAIPVATKLCADSKARKDAEETATEAVSEVDTLKAENQKLKDKIVEMQGSMDALTATKDEMVKAETDRKDKAELADLQTLAGKVGVKHDGLDLKALRVAIAKTRIDSIEPGANPAYIDGVIASVRADAAKAPDKRWDWGKKPDAPAGRTDADDEFRSPYLDAADEARGLPATTAGGAK